MTVRTGADLWVALAAIPADRLRQALFDVFVSLYGQIDQPSGPGFTFDPDSSFSADVAMDVADDLQRLGIDVADGSLYRGDDLTPQPEEPLPLEVPDYVEPMIAAAHAEADAHAR